MTKILRSRDSYTRTLIAICKRLDEAHSGAFRWKHPFNHIQLQSRFTVKSVWVVGSFARGALTCGDLDLVAEIDWHGSPAALPRKVFKALSLRHQGVSLCDGVPDNNSSLVPFGDAILIWNRHGNDWRSAINNIAPNSKATRFSRATDDIPFRPEQLTCNIEEINNLLALREEGLIKWDFIPFSSPARHGPPTKHQTDVLKLFASCGARTQLLLPHLLPYFYFHQWPSAFSQAQVGRSTFQLGDSVVSVGRPTISISLLNTLTTARLMIVPHLHVGAVNGVWCIERGDQHPLTLASERLNIWALSDNDGQLDFYQRLGCAEATTFSYSRSAVAIDLFRSLEAAQNWIAATKEDSEYVLQPVCLPPKALLSCIAATDAVSIDLTDYALTRRGAVTLGAVDIVTGKTLFDFLAG